MMAGTATDTPPATTDAVVCLLTADGRIAQPTPSLARLTRDGAEALVGRPFVTLLASSAVPAFEQAWERAHDTAAPVTCPVTLVHAPRDPGHEAQIEPAPDSGGWAVVVLHDAAAIARPRREAALLRRLTEAANSTSRTTRLFERALADIHATMGWPVGRVVDPAAGHVLSPAARQARATGTLAVVDGHVALPVLVEDEVPAVLEFPGTDLPRLDEDAQDLARSIGQQLGSVVQRERVRARLDEQARELERSNGELERFAYIASHDLQEPLRKVVGFSELVEHRYGDRLDDDGRQYLAYVVDGARRMQQLIKDLLAYSRAGRAQPAIQPVDLEALVDQVLDTLQWHVEEAGARVSVGQLPTVAGDPGQLGEVLTNLFSNAIKYAGAGGPAIAVTAHHTDEAGWCEITVADDGIGIDPRYAEQVFEVFRRLHGPTEYPGTGIGLAVTRRFVEAHGGQVWVTPNHPHGSVFHLTLPTEEPA